MCLVHVPGIEILIGCQAYQVHVITIQKKKKSCMLLGYTVLERVPDAIYMVLIKKQFVSVDITFF